MIVFVQSSPQPSLLVRHSSRLTVLLRIIRALSVAGSALTTTSFTDTIYFVEGPWSLPLLQFGEDENNLSVEDVVAIKSLLTSPG